AFREYRLERSRAEDDLLRALERARARRRPRPRDFQSVQPERDLSRLEHHDLDPRHDVFHLADGDREAFPGCGLIRRSYQSVGDVAAVATIELLKFEAALVQLEELELCDRMMQVRHPLAHHRTATRRNKQPQSFYQDACRLSFAAMMEPDERES